MLSALADRQIETILKVFGHNLLDHMIFIWGTNKISNRKIVNSKIEFKILFPNLWRNRNFKDEYYSVRTKAYALKKTFCADGFHSFIFTQGDTPSSFALGYQYFAHTGLNPNSHLKQIWITLKLPYFEFAETLEQSECESRQNARPRVRFNEIFASFSSNGKGRASPAWGQIKKNFYQTSKKNKL